MDQIVNRLQKHIGTLLFLAMCVLSLFTFDDYGIAWDESTQRDTGYISWNYVFNNHKSLLNYRDRDYGVAFELPLIFIEQLVGSQDEKTIYLTRHLSTHLFFLIGALFCFKLVDLLYNNKLLASISFLLFVLHPLMYAHSFFNTKDIPFMAMFMICFYLTAKFFKNKSIFNVLVLGSCVGLLINLRIMGILLPLCVIFFLLLDGIRGKKIAQHLKFVLILLLTAISTLYISWPYLWEDPIGNFSAALRNLSSFRWDLTELFKGELVPATLIGWDYVPTWFSITTPIPYLAMGLIGIVWLMYSFFKTPGDYFLDPVKKSNLIFLVCFAAPLLAVIILGSVVYDSWRQLYFIYSPFILLCVFGLNELLAMRYKKVIISGVIVSFIFIAGVMINLAPFQHLYFNYFVTHHKEPEYIRRHYEMDYWGTSYRQTLEYLVENNTSPEIKIHCENYCGEKNLTLLKPEQKKRLKIVPLEEAEYFISNYRWHPQDYPYKEIYKIEVLNSTVNSVFKLK